MPNSKMKQIYLKVGEKFSVQSFMVTVKNELRVIKSAKINRGTFTTKLMTTKLSFLQPFLALSQRPLGHNMQIRLTKNQGKNIYQFHLYNRDGGTLLKIVYNPTFNVSN